MPKSQFMISKMLKLKTLLLQKFHETPIGGHTRVKRTFLRLSANFFWVGIQNEVKEFVAKCVTCQTIKYSTTVPNGLL